MEKQRIAIGEDGKIQILNSQTIFKNGSLDIIIAGDYLIHSKDVIKLLTKDQAYIVRRHVPVKGFPCDVLYLDKTLNDELHLALKERDQYKESFLRLSSENERLKKEIDLLKSTTYSKKNSTKLGWF